MNVIIMGRESLMELAKQPFPADTAVISITDTDAEAVELEHLPEQLLRLEFDDVSDEIYEEFLGRKPTVREMHKLSQRFHMLSSAQAQQMAEFILRISGQTKTLICQCEYGQSRSAGVAAAVMEFYYHKGINVFADNRYYPNKYVFRKLHHALTLYGERRCP